MTNKQTKRESLFRLDVCILSIPESLRYRNASGQWVRNNFQNKCIYTNKYSGNLLRIIELLSWQWACRFVSHINPITDWCIISIHQWYYSSVYVTDLVIRIHLLCNVRWNEDCTINPCTHTLSLSHSLFRFVIIRIKVIYANKTFQYVSALKIIIL